MAPPGVSANLQPCDISVTTFGQFKSQCAGRLGSKAIPHDSQRWMMLSKEQVEAPNESPASPGLSKLMMEPPELPLHATYFPFGFPAEVRTNSETVLELFDGLW